MARELIRIALVMALAGCGRDTPAQPAAPGAPLASKAFYRVDAGPATPCARGAACEAHLVLTALGDYHVNKEYPFKFVADPAPAIQVDGIGFTLQDAKHGTLTIQFRPQAAGTSKLAGVFKLSVCSDDTCEIEAPKLEIAVPVS